MNKSKQLCGVCEFILIVWSCSIPEPMDIDLKKMEMCFVALSFRCSIVAFNILD